MAVRSCPGCGGIHFMDDTPYTRAADAGAEGHEAAWLVVFMWMNYEMAHVQAA